MEMYSEVIINDKISLTLDELNFIIESVQCNIIVTYKKDCEPYLLWKKIIEKFDTCIWIKKN